uniref:Uncharacterized protein n=1 Tax=Trichobilharzia regenti TaxID=157069 RepID=A0AA85J5X6_TRIRE|nr:unnamed protein product [Trichobilharzia regenti]
MDNNSLLSLSRFIGKERFNKCQMHTTLKESDMLLKAGSVMILLSTCYKLCLNSILSINSNKSLKFS